MVGLVLLVILFALFVGFSARDLGVGRIIVGGFLAAGFIFCGLVFVARTFVAIPSCVIDASPPIVSLKRSFRLTKPHSWKVLALLVLVATPFLLVMAGGIATIYLTPSLRLALADRTMMVVGEVIVMPFRWLPLVFIWIAAATTYVKLQAPSGLPTDKITEVFD